MPISEYTRQLADEAMQALGFANAKALVYATIQSETGGRNILGDAGNAIGFGQVWPKWHFSKLQKVADMLGVKLPLNRAPQNAAELKQIQDVVLSNDRLSMYWAVEVIKSFWLGAGGDWERFTKSYVGPAIPPADLERRRADWLYWVNELAGQRDKTGDVITAVQKVVGNDAVIYVLAGVGLLILLNKD